MKKINLQNSTTVRMSFNAATDPYSIEELEDGSRRVHMGAVGGVDQWSDLAQSRENGSLMLWGTNELEKRMEEAIIHHFFEAKSRSDDDQIAFFEAELLQHPALSFSFKKELVKKICVRTKRPAGKELDSLQSGLKSIMNWRNALAHGTMSLDGRKGVVLSYYANGQRELVLDEQFWENLEAVFASTKELLRMLPGVKA